jgi:DNA-directed RNA polymerase sigma subunit (sigma70/sigma32)
LDERELRQAIVPYQDALAQLDDERRYIYKAIREAAKDGMSLRDIGEATGMSFQRIAQIVNEPPRRRRRR